MEDFLSFIILIIGAGVAIAKSKQKKQQQPVKRARQFPPAMPTPYQPSGSAAPAAPAPAAQPVSMASMLPVREEPQAAQPTVHAHLDPDCDVHDASGSLNYKSNEGKDPCHEEQLPRKRQPLEEETAPSGLSLDWTGDNLVKAFVMQEVLTRPCQRRAR